jgi:hypothetical protein
MKVCPCGIIISFRTPLGVALKLKKTKTPGILHCTEIMAGQPMDEKRKNDRPPDNALFVF